MLGIHKNIGLVDYVAEGLGRRVKKHQQTQYLTVSRESIYALERFYLLP